MSVASIPIAEAMLLSRVAERERCARIAERVAVELGAAADGRRTRGSRGAQQLIAQHIARLIRQDVPVVPPSTTGA